MKPAIIVLIVLCVPVVAFAATLHVPSTSYPTIQDAINAASKGDTVLVSDGTYIENIDFIGKTITVKSANGASVTVIDGGNPANPDFGSVVMFLNGESLNSILEGFTLTNGSGTYDPNWGYLGGGIFCSESSPTIKDNIITLNSTEYGGGIKCYPNSSPLIQNNIISKNSASGYAGGIEFYENSNPTIKNNIILGNKAKIGGGLFCGNNSLGTITNNIIMDNYALNYVGGIYCFDKSFPIIDSNIICGNIGPWYGGGGIVVDNNSSSTIINNRIFGNSTGGFAGGIGVRNSSSTIINNRIFGNSAGQTGGGIYIYESGSALVINNAIYENSAETGGGIFCISKSAIDMKSNTIYGNSAGYKGGGMSLFLSSEVITANTIYWNNTASLGPEIYIGDSNNPSTLTISYSDVDGGKSSVHVDPGCTLNWDPGMIDADPLFVDAANGDFHLTYPSPCKDSGDNSAVLEPYDFEGDPRIAYGTVDMGADEFYTHLYYTGNATPGGNVEVKFVGLPGTSPVGLCIGTGVLDPPIPSMWGDWYLQFPIIGPIVLPAPIPSTGVLVIPGTIPGTPPGPYAIPMQALIGAELSNLSVMEVE